MEREVRSDVADHIPCGIVCKYQRITIRRVGRWRKVYQVSCVNHKYGPWQQDYKKFEEAVNSANEHLEQRHAFAFPDRHGVWWKSVGQRLVKVTVNK